MTEPISRYPLQWPVGWKRTAESRRDHGQFAKRTSKTSGAYNYTHTEKVTVAEAVKRLLLELQRFAIAEGDVVISTNVRVRLDGLPYSGEKEPTDPGAAVYWRDMGQDRCMAIDRYTKAAQNIAALAATIEAMRAIERHGGAAILDRAFTGFTALPAPIVAGMKRPWREVFNYGDGKATETAIKTIYRLLASDLHPDLGGDAAKMSELNVARDEALKECRP